MAVGGHWYPFLTHPIPFSNVGQIETVQLSMWVTCLTHNHCEPSGVGPVFHLFSLGNPDFRIYMAELRAHEFGMNFQL